jgi:hypothetical protein
MPITLDAYLFFPGNAEQAIGFYQGVRRPDHHHPGAAM